MAPRPSPQVTVIVPCFNAAPWLRDCLGSIFNQSLQAAEVIVVDDGSTDESADIAAEYPVRLLRMGTNRGASAARNAGLRAAAHERIAWLDADDFWDPCHLGSVASLLDRHDAAAVAFSRVRFVDREDRVPWGLSAPCSGPEDLLSVSVDRCVVPIMAAITRRAACLEVGGFRESLRAAVDFDLWLRLAVRWPFVWTPEVTASYRWRLAPTQISADIARQDQSVWRSRMLVLGEVPSSAWRTRAHEIAEHVRARWTEDLARAWRRRDLQTLRFLLEIPDVPGTESVFSTRLRQFLGRPAPSGRRTVPAST